MSHIHGKDTGPEILVRKALYADGFRYRVNVRKLPGTPDIVLKKYRTAVFVNGCFWHGHRNCSLATRPKTHSEYWQTKIHNNVLRDEVSVQYLEVLDWKVITVWECELKPSVRQKTLEALKERIRQNGADYIAEQKDRRQRTLEHREHLREVKERYETLMKGARKSKDLRTPSLLSVKFK